MNHAHHVYRDRRAALLKSIPVAMAGLLLDLPVFLAANRKLKRDLPVGYW